MSEQVHQFLQQSAQSGEAVSEGQFTIFGERAVRKLAEFSVERSEQWVLKWVQAAVASGATKIAFVQTRKSTEARAWLPEPPDLAQLEGCLLRLEDPGSVFWQEAVVGLRTLVTRGKLSLCTASASWAWDGESVSLMPRGLDLKGADIAASFELGELDRVAWHAGEIRELNERCRCCRVPLLLDSNPVNAPTARTNSVHERALHGRLSPRILVAGWLPFAAGLGEPEEAQAPCTDPLRSGKPLLFWRDGSWTGRTLSLRLTASHSHSSSLVESVLAKDYNLSPTLLKEEPFALGTSRFGVTVGLMKNTRFWPLGGEAVVSADELRTDFSGLKVQIDDRWLKLLDHTLRRLQVPVRVLTSRLAHYKPSSFTADLKGGLANVVTGLVGGALLGTGKGGPIGAAFAGPAGAYAGYRYSKWDEEAIVSLLQRASADASEALSQLDKDTLRSQHSNWEREL